MDPVARSDPHLRNPAACSGRRDCASGHSSLVPLLSERAGTTSRSDAPALERHARGRRRSLRSRPGSARSRTADRVCQVLAGEPFGGSHGSFAALGDRGRPSRVAGASVGSTPGPPARRLESRFGADIGRSRCPSRAATDCVDRARVVRRRSPRADRAGGAAGGTGTRDPPRGAYRGALLVDRRAPPRSCDRPVRRRTGAGVRRGWRDHRLQSDARDDHRQGAHIRTDCHWRAPAAWRRQP